MNGEPDAGDVRLKRSFDPMWSGRALIGRLRHCALLVCGAPCPHKTPAGQEHGGTIPLANIMLQLLCGVSAEGLFFAAQGFVSRRHPPGKNCNSMELPGRLLIKP